MFNNKRIDELEKRIAKLEAENRIQVETDSWFLYRTASLNSVVGKIIDYLGMRLIHEAGKPETFRIATVKKPKK